jgi:hypothetical protein
MSHKVDLGRKWKDEIGNPTTLEEMKNETHYPTLHFDDVEDKALADMPDSGTMTVHYKIRNRTHNERNNGNGKKKHTCSVTMDITHCEPPPGKAKKRNGEPDGGLRKSMSDYFKDK